MDSETKKKICFDTRIRNSKKKFKQMTFLKYLIIRKFDNYVYIKSINICTIIL